MISSRFMPLSAGPHNCFRDAGLSFIAWFYLFSYYVWQTHRFSTWWSYLKTFWRAAIFLKKKKGYLQLKVIKFKFIYIVLYIMWISLIFIQISWTTLWRGTRVHVVSVLRSVCLFTCYHDNCHKIRTVTSLVPHFPPVRSPSDIPYVHLLLWKHHKNCAREAADGL